MMRKQRILLAVASFAVTAVVGGCTVNVDLTTSPASLLVDQPVTFDVKVSNETTCPVGEVRAFVFPFIPKDTFIDRIEDAQVREALRELVDLFCTDRLPALPLGASAQCGEIAGDIVCTLQPGSMGTVGSLEQTPLFTATEGDDVTCEAVGTAIVCRIPRSMIDAAVAASTNVPEGSFTCLPIDGAVVCMTPKLNVGATKMAQFELTPGTPGVLRNWVFAVAGKDDGVCKTGTARTPCDDDTDCGGAVDSCGSGMCSGGDNDGFGCDADGDCPNGGECVECEAVDGLLLPGLACTTTAAAGPAPAMAPWALGVAGVALAGIAGFRLHRTRRR